MSEATFLTASQVGEKKLFGKKELEIFNIKGAAFPIGDLAIVQGAYVDENTNLKDRKGRYFTQSEGKKDDGSRGVKIVNENGEIEVGDPFDREIASLPILECPENPITSVGDDGLIRVHIGFYPTWAASEEMQKKLEAEYQGGNLPETGNVYHADSRRYATFTPEIYKEYQVDGQDYVRAIARADYYRKPFELSNGVEYEDGDAIWIKVEEVRGYLTEKGVIPEVIPYGGVKYNRDIKGSTKFKEGNGEEFLNEYFIKDIAQPRRNITKKKSLEEEMVVDEPVSNENTQNINNDKVMENESGMKIHPAIYAYIAYKEKNKEDVLRTEYNGDMPNADPRKWEMASEILTATKDPKMLKALVGEEITKDFESFCKQQVISIDDVINRRYTRENLDISLAEKFATVVELSSVEQCNLKAIRSFVERLGDDIKETFDILWVHGDEERAEYIKDIEAKELVKASKNVGMDR